jgi:ABC-2 type transport system permease protein
MATTPSPQPSFSPRQKWSIALSVTLSTIAAFAILVGINYLSSRYFFKRIYLSQDTRVQLSSKTLSVLKSLTNNVNITVYYDKEEPLYADIMSLLQEYEAHSRKLHVKTIDYYRDPGAAAAFQARRLMGSNTNKDFIVFESNERWDSVPGNLLNQYRYALLPMTNDEDSTMYISQKRTKFNGEMLFTAKIFSLTQAKQLKAYFLQGHGERSPADIGDLGSSKLANIFHRNYVDTRTLDNLFGTNSIPQDCSLLVIDGPRGEFQPIELDKISQYLEQGGRMFVLFDQISAGHNLGLEKVLEKWNVRIGHSTVLDMKNAADESGASFSVSALTLHDVMKPILNEKLIMLAPRPIGRIKAPSQSAADEPQVTELAFSSTNSVLTNSVDSNPGASRPYPLMVAVEKSAPKGVVTDERGATRMLITGDAYFLDNQIIGYGANEDFADAAVNWLLERTTFLDGIGPRPVSEYQLLLNPHQTNTVKGLLLGAIPGGILLFGGLVWLRRRK